MECQELRIKVSVVHVGHLQVWLRSNLQEEFNSTKTLSFQSSNLLTAHMKLVMIRVRVGEWMMPWTIFSAAMESTKVQIILMSQVILKFLKFVMIVGVVSNSK